MSLEPNSLNAKVYGCIYYASGNYAAVPKDGKWAVQLNYQDFKEATGLKRAEIITALKWLQKNGFIQIYPIRQSKSSFFYAILEYSDF